MEGDPNAALRGRAASMLVLATLFWGLSFPVSKSLGLIHERLLPGVGTVFSTSLVLTLRFTLAALVLAALNPRLVFSMTRSEFLQGAVLGLFGSLGMLFQMDGLNHTSASTSAFLTQGYCMILPFVESGLRRRWPAAGTLAGCALFMVGMAFLAGFEWGRFQLGRGEIQTLVGSAIFTGQILWLGRGTFAANRAPVFSVVMFAVIAVVSGLASLLTAPGPAAYQTLLASPSGWVLTAVLTVFCTMIAFTMMNHWQRGVSATQAGLLYGFEPVFAAGFALFLPGLTSSWAGVDYPDERLTARLLTGGLCIVAANALVQVTSSPDS